MKHTKENTLKFDINYIRQVFVVAYLMLQAILLTISIEYITFADQNTVNTFLAETNLYFIIITVVLIFVVLLLLFQGFKKLLPGVLVVSVFSVVTSVINNMKWMNLKECVTISDFAKLSEALKVAGEADFHFDISIVICGVLICVSIFIAFCMDRFVVLKMEQKQVYFKICKRIGVVLCIVLLPVLVVDLNKSVVAKLTESNTAETTGPLMYFMESFATVAFDQDYSEEEAISSYDAQVNKGKELYPASKKISVADIEKPNVIVIMSEAFYDVNRFEGVLSYDKDPMQYFYEIADEGITGNTMTNIYGGSTHYSEFEFLTGWNSKSMNSGSCPYKEDFDEHQPSLVRYLKDLGYYSIAIHPYDGRFWKRYIAYPYMGFDKFVDRSQMTYTEMCGYISDESLTNEIIYQYEKKESSNKPFFCFGVSIANHIAIINGDRKENMSTAIDVTYEKEIPGYSDAKKERVNQYISGIYETGKALKQLTDYFETKEEPTVIVFFGDHAPNYAIDILNAGKKDKDLAYSTPYLIWSNYDMTKTVESSYFEDGMDLNVSYLSTYMLDKLQMPLPTQGYYNVALQAEYPIETRYIICNEFGRQYDSFSKKEKSEYFNHALDLKKQIQAIVEEPKMASDIWDYPY